MTLPALIANYQKKVLREQFRVAYSLLQQTWRKVEADWEYLPECYYWDKRPYSSKCIEWDEWGGCKKTVLPDGSPLPSDYNGHFAECNNFMEAISKNLQVISICKGNGYAKGCIPEYEGVDTIAQKNSTTEMSDDEAFSLSRGCGSFRKQQILKNRTIYVLKNGMILFPYSGPQLFAIDINGKKGPNKWGYDLFTFQTKSNIGAPLNITPGGCMIVEKGGQSTQQMLMSTYMRK